MTHTDPTITELARWLVEADDVWDWLFDNQDKQFLSRWGDAIDEALEISRDAYGCLKKIISDG